MSRTWVAAVAPGATILSFPAFSATSMRPSGVQATAVGPVKLPTSVRSSKPAG